MSSRPGDRRGHVGRALTRRDADDVAAALLGDVPHRRHPHIGVVPRRRQEHVDALLVHRDARERHVVLPADQAADVSERRVDHRERGAVALAPHEALAAGRHQLAVLAQQVAVGTEVEERVVDRPRGALVHRDREEAVVLAGDRAEGVARGPGHVDALVGPPDVPVGVRPGCGAPHPVGIGGHEPFREGDEARAARDRLLREVADLVDRGLPVEKAPAPLALLPPDCSLCSALGPAGPGSLGRLAARRRYPPPDARSFGDVRTALR